MHSSNPYQRDRKTPASSLGSFLAEVMANADLGAAVRRAEAAVSIIGRSTLGPSMLFCPTCGNMLQSGEGVRGRQRQQCQIVVRRSFTITEVA